MAKTWLPDPSHYPEQMTPLSATVWFASMGRGLHEAMRTLAGPFGGFETRTELGWAYEGELDPDWEHEPTVLREAALTLAERWERELRPRVEALTREQEAMRPEEPPPPEAAALLDRLLEIVREQWTIHFLVVVPAQVAMELLHDRYVELLGDDDPLAPYRLLEGLPNESTTADRELARLAERARELRVERLVREHAPADALVRLRELQDGRRFLHELDAYLLCYGGRARWHELSLPREAEQPTMTLEAVRLALELGERPARAPAPDDGDDRLRAAYALKELHTYDIDYPGLLATREALLAFGRRLVGEGLLDAVDDVWMLERDELRRALTDSLDLRALVAERREEQARGLAEGVQPFLGEPPDERTRDTVVESFYGSGGTALKGAGASPGVAEGVARVVADASDFARIQRGDILVTTMTTPAWTPLFPSLAGLVTETGGILSHAAVVAREYGLPAVVGAAGAVTAIPDGKRVRIDGTSGAISLL